MDTAQDITMKHLLVVRDAYEDILKLKMAKFERYRSCGVGHGVSEEDFENAQIEVYRAKIDLAKAELELLFYIKSS